MNAPALDIDGNIDGAIEFGEGQAGTLLFDTVTLHDGTDDYEILKNKPLIEEVELVGNKTLEELGVGVASHHEIDKMFFG